MQPTNITLLNPNKVAWALMKAVTSTDVHEGMTNNLHEDGLYSPTIFGRVGTDQRDKTQSYINVKIPVFNPTYFKALIGLKGLYLGIIKGTEYALWDASERDFIKSNLLEGETGYGFFMRHFYDLEPKLNESYKRKQRVELFNKFKDIALTKNIIVLPAGIRDIQVEPNGQIVEPEINDFYRKLIFRSRSVVIQEGEEDNPIYDNIRWAIQSVFNDIDDYIFRLMEGKRGFLQRRVSTRGVVGGTRNVITARKVSVADADDDNGVDVNTTDIGMYQALLGFQYVARYALLKGFLSRVFTVGSSTAKLVDPRTFEYQYVEVESNIVDKWLSADGLTALFNGFGTRHLRHKPIKINGYYMGLTYDDGKYVKLLGDVTELPPGFDRKFCKPLTYMELFYLSCVEEIEKRMLQVTRYPITGMGSIYPSLIKIKTTTNAEKRIILDDYWEEGYRCTYYPVRETKPDYFDAMSVDGSRLGLLGGDFDGDQLNSNSINGEDAIAEAKALMGRRDYYITGTGQFLYSPTVEPHEFLFRNLSNGLNL